MLRHVLHIFRIIICGVILVTVLLSCSTQKNTRTTRWWHSFTARYNTYYNGSVAYIDGSLAKEEGNKDNYTELLPLYTVANKSSRDLGSANFETAITKSKKAIKQHSIKKRPQWTSNRRKTERDIEWLNRREYNPFIWKAWMLLGRSQFHKGAFDEAASTFAYMSRLYRTQPAIYGKARAWLAKSYIEQGWIYDAEDVIRNMSRDSIDWRAQKEWNYTYADYYLRTGDYEQAESYLRKVISREQRSVQKAREWYILGQILALQQKPAAAYDAFRHVIRQNPPYELELNARIAMTENLTSSGSQTVSKAKLRTLRRMARSDKNKDYLDQVYYAMGNVYLADRDTANAISSYEKGVSKATRSGIEKGVLLLHLGDIYWEKEKFSDARRCYNDALGLLDKERPDYEQLTNRTRILDELCPHTDNIHLQDSLQTLARMSEKDRIAVIDRIISDLKKKEREQRLAQLEQQNTGGQAGTNPVSSAQRPAAQKPVGQQSGTWYFYSPIAVRQGMQTFAQQWGKRANADDWRRINKTVVASDQTGYEADPSAADSLSTPGLTDSDNSTASDSLANDPHERAYYLSQIPLTPEQIEESNEIIAEALYQAAVIFKDKLDNLQLSAKAFDRLMKLKPENDHLPEIWYHLFLLHSRKGSHSLASGYRDRLISDYPDHELTQILNDPYFETNARYGLHLEDSLYASTYDAFRSRDYATVLINGRESERRFAKGAHRDKFLFINALVQLEQGRVDSCLNAMQRIVSDYPQAETAPLAGMILNGVKAGRRLQQTTYDIADIWDYRTSQTTEAGDTTTWAFTDDPADEYVFLMTYHPDSLAAGADSQTAENRLLFEIARFNFTNYLVRNFDMTIEPFQNLRQLMVSGFHNHAEALVYARAVTSNAAIRNRSHGCRNIIISRHNLELLGTRLSYNDYDQFYAEHFAPLPLPEETLLYEQDLSPEQYDPEMKDDPTPSDGAEGNDAETPVNAGRQQGDPLDMIVIDEPQQSNAGKKQQQDPLGTIVSDEPQPDNASKKQQQDPLGTIVSDEPQQSNAGKKQQQDPLGTIVSDEPQPDNAGKKQQQDPLGTIVSDEPQQSNSGKKQQQDPLGTIVSDEPQQSNGGKKQQQDPLGTIVSDGPQPDNAGKKQTGAKDNSDKRQTAVNAPAKKSAAPARNKNTVRQSLNSNILEIIDDEATAAPATKKPQPKKKQQKKNDDDDEYFDFVGF